MTTTRQCDRPVQTLAGRTTPVPPALLLPFREVVKARLTQLACPAQPGTPVRGDPGFSITLASAFTGCYKYRERSYFLRQTAAAIKEELNAVMLDIGDYSQFIKEQEDQALAKFTQRVEVLCYEQRRREQQLVMSWWRAE